MDNDKLQGDRLGQGDSHNGAPARAVPPVLTEKEVGHLPAGEYTCPVKEAAKLALGDYRRIK